MKTGRTIAELALEIQRQQDSKRDYVAKTDKIDVEADRSADFSVPDRVKLNLMASGKFAINDLAHEQIAAHTGIPNAYYNRMKSEDPALLANNVQAWFTRYPAPRMVRTLDNRVRAFLSDSYRPLENYDLAEAVLPTLLDNQLEIMSCEITERRLYIKAVDPRITRDVPTGRKMGDGSHCFFDTCSPAIIISNSEVGSGRLSVDSGVYTKVCTNMAMIAKSGMRRTHVGAKYAAVLGDGVENIDRLLTSETRKATDRAIWLQVRDVVKGAFDEAVFTARCGELAGMVADKIEDPVRVVELSAKKFGLSALVEKSIQRHLVEGADLTRYGLFNAVTRSAQDVESYDAASDLERLGGRILALGKTEWAELAVA